MASEIDRAEKVLARIDLEKCKKEIAQAEQVLATKKVRLAALIQAKAAAGGNGRADPTAPVRETILDRVKEYLKDRQATTTEIGLAIGKNRAVVHQVIKKHPEEFRLKDGFWRLK